MQRFIYPKIIPDLYYKKKAYKKICSPKYKKNMADKTRGGKQKNLSQSLRGYSHFMNRSVNLSHLLIHVIFFLSSFCWCLSFTISLLYYITIWTTCIIFKPSISQTLTSLQVFSHQVLRLCKNLKRQKIYKDCGKTGFCSADRHQSDRLEEKMKVLSSLADTWHTMTFLTQYLTY